MRLRRTRLRALALTASALAAAGLLVACTGDKAAAPSAAPSRPPYSPRPNIVFVLTDDLSSNLLPYMPQVRKLAAEGMSFSNYSVTDSLCCPSRASIFTGKYPHNTGVFTNDLPDGGLLAFNKYGGPKASYGLALQQGGYRTALTGKYLNRYLVGARLGNLPENYVPEGWSTWAVGAGAYANFRYSLNEDGDVVSYGNRPEDYLTRVITKIGVSFIEKSVAARKPFSLELSTYSPHQPYVPDPVDAKSFPGLKAPRGASFNALPKNAPPWLARNRKPLTARQIAELDTVFRKRVQSVQSIDRAIGQLRATLERTGQARNTVFVFSSDNGYHLGEHGLLAGKRTAFDTDVHVPLVVAGPGIPAGVTTTAMVQNIDLAPTFEELAGRPPRTDVDGRSLVPLLRGEKVAWRTRALVEHHGAAIADPQDPDKQSRAAGAPPSYDSLRGPDWTYVRYFDGEREYYNRAEDPDEMNNLAGSLSPATLAALDRELDAMRTCAGPQRCWTAGLPKRP